MQPYTFVMVSPQKKQRYYCTLYKGTPVFSQPRRRRPVLNSLQHRKVLGNIVLIIRIVFYISYKKGWVVQWSRRRQCDDLCGAVVATRYDRGLQTPVERSRVQFPGQRFRLSFFLFFVARFFVAAAVAHPAGGSIYPRPVWRSQVGVESGRNGIRLARVLSVWKAVEGLAPTARQKTSAS